MFIVEAVGNREIFNNSLKDDFLQFLPNHFGCEPSEITAYYVEDSEFEKWKKRNRGVEFEVILDATSPKVSIMRWHPPAEITPNLQPGDDDPNKPGQKVGPLDPRTEPSMAPAYRELVMSMDGKKLAAWPYETVTPPPPTDPNEERKPPYEKFLGHAFESAPV